MIRCRRMLTQRIKIHGNSADELALQIASAAILGGSVIAVPTETFYALAADPFNLQAVDQIFAIKGRQDWKPLLLLVDSVDQVERITEDIPHRFYEIAERFWPGPLTLILPAAKTLPRKVTAFSNRGEMEKIETTSPSLSGRCRPS